MKNKLLSTKTLFFIILIFATVARLVFLGGLPAGINQDEAMGAMDAYALSMYGTDRFGMHMPVHFTAWGESQMSVLLAYFMVPFIKIFGFSTFAIRLPMAIISSVSIAVIFFITKGIFNDSRLALFTMFITAINPWQFIQSRWAIDCNMFPHIFLIGFLLLLYGLKKRWALYLSMLFFGLTFYSYGIAVYTVPVFLFVFALYCLIKKQLELRDIIISILIFTVVALPEILVMVVNMFHLHSIETPLFTIPCFPESVRSNDILFLNFSFAQLGKNALSMLMHVFIQTPDYIFNTIPFFGPLYHVSIPFMIIGIIMTTFHFFRESQIEIKAKYLALLGFLLSGIWVGLITYEVNVNRVNIIFYPLIIFTGVGIFETVEFIKKQTGKSLALAFTLLYMALGCAFFISYGTYYKESIKPWFSVNFLDAVSVADSMDDIDALYITSSMETQTNAKMAEILTEYALKMDSKYFQEETNSLNGRTLLPYSERYHFVDRETKKTTSRKPFAYITKKSENSTVTEGYEVIYENETYAVLK
jgi:4-amino-4-deoxy-L-arabinose transferase-like glycosyltransferase